MKKNISISTFVICVFMIISCNTANKKTIESTSVAMTTISGIFESKQGVMTDIGCYCYKVGYLTPDKSFPVVVCFDELTKNEKVECSEKLTVHGYYKTIKVEKQENNPCSTGEMEVFMVTSYNCE